MYCKICGQRIDEETIYCPYCGNKTTINNTVYVNDSPSFGFALLGFFIPIIGLILYLVYEHKQPKRAKSAGKGALIGFITKIVIAIILVVLYFVGVATLISDISEDVYNDTSIGSTLFEKESTEDVLNNYIDVSFGDLEIINNGYYDQTALDVTITNISGNRYTFYITIEAVNPNGARLGTDIVYADKLNAGQPITVKAFEYIEKDKLEEFRTATFKVLDIQYYNF